MKFTFIASILLSFEIFSCQNLKLVKQSLSESENIAKEKTVFQTSSPWMFEIDIRSDVAIDYGVHANPTKGKQKLTFEELVKSWRNRGYSTHFTTDSPFGPIERVGKILKQDPSITTRATLHSVVLKPNTDNYYIVYHRNPLTETDGNSRETCIDRMHFNKNGTIKPVIMTNEGVQANKI